MDRRRDPLQSVADSLNRFSDRRFGVFRDVAISHDMTNEFHPWSPSHLVVILLTIALPVLLALLVRRTKSRRLEATIRFTISALLLINYVGYVLVARNFGIDRWYKLLPL